MPPEFSEALRKRIGRNLKTLREKAGMPQYQLAKLLGCSTASMSHWERGDCLISLDVALWLCKVMGWRFNDLIGGNKGGREKELCLQDQDTESVSNDKQPGRG